MKRLIIGRLMGVLSTVALLGCGQDPDEVTGTPVTPMVSGSTVAPAVAPGQCLTATAADGSLLLTASDANNYTFSNLLTVKTTNIKPNSFITLDWTGLTQDFLKQPLSPTADVDMASIVMWTLTHEQIIEDLNADTLGDRGIYGSLFQVTNKAVTSVSTQGMFIPMTAEPLKDVDLLKGFDAVQVPPEKYTYTVMINHGTTVGEGVKMIHAMKLDPTSENTVVTVGNDSTVVNHTADLHTKPPVLVPAANGNISVEWLGMQTNALGRPFAPRHVGEVRVVHVPLTPAEIEDQFLGLQTLGDATYSGAVAEDGKFNLSALKDETGAAFPGINPAMGGTWLLALVCFANKCGNPAPWYMTRLEACPAP